MRRRLQPQRRAGLDPLFALMDCSMSLMFAMALFVRPQTAETIEVPVSKSPASASASAPNQETRPIVQVDATGAVTFNGQPTALEAVADAVRQVVSSQDGMTSNITIRMEAHRQAEYGRVFAVREQLQRAGFDLVEIGQVDTARGPE